MRQDFPKLGIKLLCRLFGKTRHAYYDHQWRLQNDVLKDEVVLKEVLLIRESLPRLGTLKLHAMLKPILEIHQLKIGRDYLFEFMRERNLHIRTRRRQAITTDSRHWMHKYNNLIKDLQVCRPEQLWVSDITYIRLVGQFGYLSLITDAYSKKIMGYSFRTDLSAQGCIDALKMAIAQRQYSSGSTIHHSDRGSQYCCKEYVDLLISNGIAISMTENGDPYENAIAERINGILKSEFNLYNSNLGFKETYSHIEKSIKAYNELRPHASCDYLTPEQAHQTKGDLKKRWKQKNTNKIKKQTCISQSGITNSYV